MILTVLWEDQRAVGARSFGPQELLLACLEDRTRVSRHELRHLVVGVPKKGVGKVVRALSKDLD